MLYQLRYSRGGAVNVPKGASKVKGNLQGTCIRATPAVGIARMTGDSLDVNLDMNAVSFARLKGCIFCRPSIRGCDCNAGPAKSASLGNAPHLGRNGPDRR